MKTSWHPAFTGFAGHFRHEIAPSLLALEPDRRRLVRDCVLIVAAALVVFAAILWLAVVVTHSVALGFVGFVIAGAVVVFGLNWRLQDDYMQVNDLLLGGIAGYLGLKHTSAATRPRSLETFRARNLVPRNNRVECGDIVEGVWQGVSFACSEAWFSYNASGERGERDVFAGQLFRIDLPFSLAEPVMLIGRKAWFAARRRPFIGAVDVTRRTGELRRHFAVWGETDTAGRMLATHNLVPVLIKLARRYRRHKLRLWLHRNRLYLAIDNGDQLNPGSLFAPLHSLRRVGRAVTGYSEILRTVEAFAR